MGISTHFDECVLKNETKHKNNNDSNNEKNNKILTQQKLNSTKSHNTGEKFGEKSHLNPMLLFGNRK